MSDDHPTSTPVPTPPSRVGGIGGIFFKARDPKALAEWYRVHLGLDVEPWGGAALRWAGPHNPGGVGTTIWSPFAADTGYFAPSEASFMVNYRVADLHGLLAALRAEGCDVMDKVDESEYGKFGWVMDPEGNKLELWQPPEGQ
ncbi:MAG: VOC family protein [Rubrivivax sp.]|nr:VOC family protein [Rubrivivax sp.]